MFICQNSEGVHAYLLKWRRGTCSFVRMLKGYMVRERLGTCGLAQPLCRCSSLSVSIVLNVRFTTNGMWVMNNTRVAWTSRHKISTTWDLYCCLVPQCEGLLTCCSAFPITTKWFFDQDVKVVPGTTFILVCVYLLHIWQAYIGMQ